MDNPYLRQGYQLEQAIRTRTHEVSVDAFTGHGFIDQEGLFLRADDDPLTWIGAVVQEVTGQVPEPADNEQTLRWVLAAAGLASMYVGPDVVWDVATGDEGEEWAEDVHGRLSP